MRTMNTDIELIGCSPEQATRLRRCALWLRAFEARFSRFAPESELSQLNRSRGRPTRASPVMFELVRLALDFALRSDGLFDPTILRGLEAAGYGRSFDRFMPRGAAFTPRSGVGSWRDVALDPTGRKVSLHNSSAIDLGGIAKGWAADRLAAYVGPGCVINVGGDLLASGAPADSPRWLVGIEDPHDSRNDLMTLAVKERGVATSSQLRRSWQGDGERRHHLIDPRTGVPAESDVAQVTAIAASAMLAEFHAKVALLLGSVEGCAYLERQPGVEGVLVTMEHDLVTTTGISELAFRSSREPVAV